MAGTTAHMLESPALKGLLESLLKAIKRRSLTSTGFGWGWRKWASLRRMLLRAPSRSAFVCQRWGWLGMGKALLLHNLAPNCEEVLPSTSGTQWAAPQGSLLRRLGGWWVGTCLPLCPDNPCVFSSHARHGPAGLVCNSVAPKCDLLSQQPSRYLEVACGKARFYLLL